MPSFADAHRKWQQAKQDAERIGSKAARDEAERLRQQLIEHPAVQRARKLTNARPVR